MALTYQDLAGMSQEDVIKHLMELYGTEKLQMTEQAGGDVSTGQPVYRSQFNESLVNPNVTGYEWKTEGDNAWNAPIHDGYRTQLTSVIDPTVDGGQYGYYDGIYDADGNLKDVEFQKAERHKGWFGENIDWLGPLMVLGPAAYSAFGAGAATYGLDPAMAASTGAAEAGSLSSLAPISASVGMTPAEILGTSGSNAATAGGIDYVTGMAPAGASTVGTAAGGAAGTAGALSGAKTIAEALGGAKGIATALGAGAGLVSSLTAPDEKTELKNNKLDPRMDAWVFGQGGLLEKLKGEVNRGPMPGLQSAFNIAGNYLGGTGASGSFGRPGLMGVNGTPWAR